MKRLVHVAAALILAAPSLAAAHEFWLRPSPFAIVPGDSATLAMYVGEHFDGEQVAFSPGHAASIQVHAGGLQTDLRRQLRLHAEQPVLQLAFPKAGTHVIAFDSAPSLITLSADKFHAYLHEEGLEAVIRQREQDGSTAAPGRERYRRNAKTLVQVGLPDANYAARTGQKLEILPLADPLKAVPGDTLGFRLLFDDKPLANALVKAWHRRDGQTLTIRARSDAQGRVRLTLPYAGPWMVGTVHMVPVSDGSEADWDSYWGNLTFEIGAK
jgi:uncharacterized GH25 family protein